MLSGGLLDTRCWITRLTLVAARRSSIAQDRCQYFYYYYCVTRELEKNEHTHMCRTTDHMPCPHQWRTINPDRPRPPAKLSLNLGVKIIWNFSTLLQTQQLGSWELGPVLGWVIFCLFLGRTSNVSFSLIIIIFWKTI
jgi:hypothetical protein